MSDFSDNKSELDEYGVWVKKPPVENEITDTPAEEPVVDASFIEQAAASDQVIEQDLAEFDIDSLAIDETEIAADDETSVSDFDPQETVIDESSTQDISEESFMTEETPVVGEPSVEDFMQTEAVPEQEESVPSPDEISLDDFSLDKLHEENKPMSFTPDESDVSGAQPETEPQEAAPSFEDGEIDLDSFMSDDSAPKADSTPDGDVDLSSFMDDSAPADGDVDLSAFMGGGDSPDFGNGDIDLEAFMGSEGFASDKQEQEEIEDADPLDIDLDFETTDVELQDAEASGDVSGIVTASTYPDMSETTEVEDFDALFDEIVDETPQEKKTPAPAPEPKQQTDDGSEEIDLSDFGFEDNPENQNPILGDSKEEQKVKAGPVDYEMNVMMKIHRNLLAAQRRKSLRKQQKKTTKMTSRSIFPRIQKRPSRKNRKQTFHLLTTALTLIRFSTMLKMKMAEQSPSTEFQSMKKRLQTTSLCFKNRRRRNQFLDRLLNQ